ncbi:MAG TPA: hypothetical protein VIC54_05245 [Terriglobales bacterium]|jgi:hypothetical protein
MPRFTVKLAAPAQEMAREEILKQATFLSRDLRQVEFAADGQEISFEAPAAAGLALSVALERLAMQIGRALRKLERKVVLRTPEMERPLPERVGPMPGVGFLGPGQAVLQGVALQLFHYFDAAFERMGGRWNAVPVRTPTLIPSRALAKCDYFRSFPQYVTFAAHLHEDGEAIERFRRRHEALDDLDDGVAAELDRPEACLSPAVCYHIYHLHENTVLPRSGSVHGVCGKCFRYESGNMKDLRRLWDFTLREIVFMGSREDVLAARDQTVAVMSDFLQEHRMAAEIRTASDPFFIAPDAVSKTFFQLSSDSKLEISVQLRGSERLAVGSHNYHSDFFGRVFNVEVEGAGTMQSVCVGFGLERWVYGFIEQHGADPRRWPDPVRHALSSSVEGGGAGAGA